MVDEFTKTQHTERRQLIAHFENFGNNLSQKHVFHMVECARYYSQRKKVINIFDVSLFCPIYKMLLAGGDVHPGSSATSVASEFLARDNHRC